jgi:thiol-disulfide isomerase/thioredoxin
MTIASLLLALLITLPSGAASSEPVLLDFHADWCGPCRQMRPALEQLSQKGYPIRSIDIDRSPALREKYGVEAVPTFIVVDASGNEIDRTSGSQPAAQLARFYREAKARAKPPTNSLAHADGDDAEQGDGEVDHAEKATPVEQADADPKATPENDPEARPEPVFTNPRPWETVVRIRVLAQGSVGFGSGTIIHSTPKETLILTCAHIFKLDGRHQAPPQQFPRKIMIDLFDGKLHGEKPAQVHYVESVEGQAVDYDFTLDVGLIRMRPGRRLAAARVVPAHWEPRPRMKMLTVGCSEGHDATAWHTLILNPQMRGLSGNNQYQAIECMIAPKQGRSGGGLFTTDGYVAGVCNFAEPRGDHGLYATPRSIYSILDRNNLMALYEPVTRGTPTLVADRGGDGSRRRGNSAITIARGQSPDREEKDGARARVKPGDVTVPDPELLGIKPPLTALRTRAEAGASTRRMAWHPTPKDPAPAKLGPIEPIGKTEPTDLSIDEAADDDKFSRFEPQPSPSANAANPEDLPSPNSPDASGNPKSRWRASTAGGRPISKSDEP